MSVVKISLTKEDIEMCWNFASTIISEKNQFNRMIKFGLNKQDEILYRIKRTFVGKIGEIAFYRFLEQNKINPGNLVKMFEIYEGEQNVDKFDFQTKKGLTIDVKTAVFQNHKNLVVPYDQFKNMAKDIYVGIKLDIPLNIKDYDETFTKDVVKDVFIYGYVMYEDLKNLQTTNLGEFPCKAVSIFKLKNIMELLALFK